MRLILGRESNQPYFIAVVPLVTHVKCFGKKSFDINSAAGIDGFIQNWSQHSLHPSQAVLRILIVRAISQYFAIAFIQIRVGTIPMYLILDNVDQHRGRGHARHRTDCLVVVAGFQHNFATFDERLSLRQIVALPSKISAPVMAPRALVLMPAPK